MIRGGESGGFEPAAPADGFWNAPAQVERFASRDPDHRLIRVVGAVSCPADLRVLDVGCAGGRNTQWLAEQGCDVHAVDAAPAMIAHTRRRVAAGLGEEEACRRVRCGVMDDLKHFPNADFDLVVALGVYHLATSRREWEGALGETARVVRVGGRVLVAVFDPRSAPAGRPLRRLPGDELLYEGFASGPAWLVEADELDREMADRALHPVVPTETVEVRAGKGTRVTVNGLYERRGGAGISRRSRAGIAPAFTPEGV